MPHERGFRLASRGWSWEIRATKPVGGGISEMRIDYGPGYRVYYMQRGRTFVILLCGGDKRTQATDIKRAKTIAAQWREQE